MRSNIKKIIKYSFLIIATFLFHSATTNAQDSTSTVNGKTKKGSWYVEGYTSNCFPGVIENNQLEKFKKITIFNRWGKLVYQSSDANQNWVCKDEIPVDLKPGVYAFVFTSNLKDEEGKDINHMGTITLILGDE